MMMSIEVDVVSGVSASAVFGINGGVTGVLVDHVERRTIAQALSQEDIRYNGERYVGLLSTERGDLQVDDVVVADGEDITINHAAFEINWLLVFENLGCRRLFLQTRSMARRGRWSDNMEKCVLPGEE